MDLAAHASLRSATRWGLSLALLVAAGPRASAQDVSVTNMTAGFQSGPFVSLSVDPGNSLRVRVRVVGDIAEGGGDGGG